MRAACLAAIELMKLVQPTLEENKFDWLDGLAILLDPTIGGNYITTMLSRRAAIEGADAIIYPSARNDFYAVVMESELVRFAGWNLVDLTEYSPAAVDLEDLIGTQLPARFWCGYMPETRDEVRTLTYDRAFGEQNPYLLLDCVSRTKQGLHLYCGS